MFTPKKTLGQNFLINPHILDKITSVAEISKNDIILEVGPGTGLLTKKLADKAGRVVAIEKDHRLIEPLRERFRGYTNVEIIESDILELDPTALKSYCANGYKIVGNIPYYITSNLLRTIFEKWPTPKLIVLTIQKEVAQRIMAMPAQAGKPPRMNLLALSVQYYSEPEIIGYISKNNFRPIPKVDSAIIKLRPHNQDYRATALQANKLFSLIKIGFSEKRKHLANLLAKKLDTDKEGIADAFQKTGIKSDARAENLSLEQWQELKEQLPG